MRSRKRGRIAAQVGLLLAAFVDPGRAESACSGGSCLQDASPACEIAPLPPPFTSVLAAAGDEYRVMVSHRGFDPGDAAPRAEVECFSAFRSTTAERVDAFRIAIICPEVRKGVHPVRRARILDPAAGVWRECLGSVQVEGVLVPPGGRIRLVAPVAQQIVQRGDGASKIEIVGDYLGDPKAIEARHAAGDWVTIDELPAAGRFRGALRVVPAQGDLEVRFSNFPWVRDLAQRVGVGDVFVIAGYSNAVGGGDRLNRSHHPSLTAVVSQGAGWQRADDPFYEGKGGSPWPLLATHFMRSQNIAIGFIQTAWGGTCLAAASRCDNHWEKDGHASLYDLLLGAIRARTSPPGRLTAVLLDLGQADALMGIESAEFKAALAGLIADLQADLGNADLKLIPAATGYLRTGSSPDEPSDSRIDAVRSAIVSAWNDNPSILAGPTTYDLAPLRDGVHYTAPAHIETLADRWWAAIHHHFYGGRDGRGPRLVAAYAFDSRERVLVHFTDESLPLLPERDATGFVLLDDGGSVEVESTRRFLDHSYVLTLHEPLEGNATVSLGSGRNGGNVTDSSRFRLPAETFVNVPIVGLP